MLHTELSKATTKKFFLKILGDVTIGQLIGTSSSRNVW